MFNIFLSCFRTLLLRLVHSKFSKLTNVSAFMNTTKNKLDQLKVVHARLEALEKQFMDELVEDGRKEQPDSFVSSMSEVKKQLKDLNLVEDLDKFLQDARRDDQESGQAASGGHWRVDIETRWTYGRLFPIVPTLPHAVPVEQQNFKILNFFYLNLVRLVLSYVNILLDICVAQVGNILNRKTNSKKPHDLDDI